VFDDILSWGDHHELMLSRSFSSSSGGISGIPLMIVYGIELLAFLSPVIFVFMFQKDYFCESCGSFYEDQQFYVRDLDETKMASAESSGDFRFIADLVSYKTTPDMIGPAWQIEFGHCETCKLNGVIDIYRGTVEMDSKDRKMTFENQSAVVTKTIVSSYTIAPLSQKQHTYQ
jgi:hypothetical protein